MRIEVIEGGNPNGTDLVLMGDHKLNPVAHANGASRPTKMGQPVPYLPLGDSDAVLAEVRLVAALDPEDKENVVLLATGVVGRQSQIAGFRGMPFVFCEIGRVPIAQIKGQIAQAIDGPGEPQ